MQAARTQMQGNANVLRTESKLDGGNEAKDAQADALESQSSNLMGDFMGEVTDVAETLKPDDKAKGEEKQAEKSAESSRRADKVTLSDHASDRKGPVAAPHPAEEPSTYRADGSKVPSAVSKSTPSFEAVV